VKKKIPKIQWGIFKTPLGWSAAAWTPRGLSSLVLPQKSKEKARREIRQSFSSVPADFWTETRTSVPRKVQHQTRLALCGNPFRFSKFDISFLTPFQRKILKATRWIPRGQTRSYGWIAEKVGSPKGFRAVGQALNRNPIPLFIPCHRVVARDGRLGGYGSGIKWKIRLLKNEGVMINRAIEGSYRLQKL
jgi:methylated-DNA-[protein]-cysteine S-methyltransferase